MSLAFSILGDKMKAMDVADFAQAGRCVSDGLTASLRFMYGLLSLSCDLSLVTYSRPQCLHQHLPGLGLVFNNLTS